MLRKLSIVLLEIRNTTEGGSGGSQDETLRLDGGLMSTPRRAHPAQAGAHWHDECLPACIDFTFIASGPGARIQGKHLRGR